ncbi:MAG: pilus assembly PilX family protein [Burkholderiaceae bacterium]
MLDRKLAPIGRCPRARQDGVVLVLAIIVLVAMTLAGLALMRSVDTNTIIAGNLAFRQAAVHSGDEAIENAFQFLQANNTGSGLDGDIPANGYSAGGAANNPTTGQSWDDYWLTSRSVSGVYSATVQDAAGNGYSYVIDRMCGASGAQGLAACTYSPLVNSVGGQLLVAGQHQVNSTSDVYYRITVRVTGPKNTVSYIQAVVSM